MKKIVLAIIILFLFNSNTCKPPLMEEFYSIVVNNKPSVPVSVYLVDGGVDGHQHPDTLLPVTRPALVTIEPGKSFNFDSRKPWTEIIKNLNSDTLSVYFINANTYRDSMWTSIRQGNLILKRYDLSVNDFETTNWRVNYQ